MAVERLLLGGDRFVDLRGQVALSGTTRQKLRAHLKRLPGGEPQRPSVLRCGLEMRARGSSPFGGAGRPVQDALGIAGRLGVMCKAREIRISARAPGERRERVAM